MQNRTQVKLVTYIEDLQERIKCLRTRDYALSDERVACETVADSLELVVRELTDLLEVT